MVNKVPNQREITVKKEVSDKKHKYSIHNLAALDEAAIRLQSDAGFKLYMYIAKNQDKYNFALSRADFMRWSGFKDKAYKSAFAELEKEGYLVLKEGKKDVYTFYEKSQIPEEKVTIEIPEEKVQEIKAAKKQLLQ